MQPSITVIVGFLYQIPCQIFVLHIQELPVVFSPDEVVSIIIYVLENLFQIVIAEESILIAGGNQEFCETNGLRILQVNILQNSVHLRLCDQQVVLVFEGLHEVVGLQFPLLLVVQTVEYYLKIFFFLRINHGLGHMEKNGLLEAIAQLQTPHVSYHIEGNCLGQGQVVLGEFGEPFMFEDLIYS